MLLGVSELADKLTNISWVVVILTHCGQVTPYGEIDMDIYDAKTSPKRRLTHNQKLITKNLKMAYLKILPHLPGDNGFMKCHTNWLTSGPVHCNVAHNAAMKRLTLLPLDNMVAELQTMILSANSPMKIGQFRYFLH